MTTVDVAFERVVLDGLGRILLSAADRHRAAETLELVRHRIAEIPPVAFKHKVTTIVAQNAAILGDSGDDGELARQLGDLLSSDLADALRHRQLLEEELLSISGTLASTAIVLKGFCNGRFYPPPYVRWMRDIDVMCPTWEDAVELLEALLGRGYVYDEDESPWVKADPSRNRNLYGQIFLIRPEGDDFCRVDIHYGTYSVGYSGYLDVDWDGLSTSTPLGDREIRVLEPEACLLVAQSHALSDGYVAIKDINDFVAMATSGKAVDWRTAGERLRDHSLSPQASLLAQHVRFLYDDGRVRAAASELLGATGQHSRTFWRTHDRSWNLRARVNASFAFRWHRCQGDNLPQAALRMFQCYLFYVRRLRLEVRDRSLREKLLRRIMPEPDLTHWRPRPDACTLLIDADVVRRLASNLTTPSRSIAWSAVADGIEVAGPPESQFIKIRGRTFVPTLDLLIPPAHAAALAASQ